MTTERVPTIRMLIKQWCPSGLGAESEWLIATLEAREREVLAAAKVEAATSALEQAAKVARGWRSTICTCDAKSVSTCHMAISQDILALSPNPNPRALWEAEARLEEAKQWAHNWFGGPQINCTCRDCKHIAELESAVARLREEK